ncbi:hypothetical protein MKW92_028121 [Papaver armeniacum]|nr:hypothetical protein MKW92_028121 [Papaver armeniacum]
MQMDKRSVLVDALAYLQDILNQTQKEIEAGTTEDPGQPIIDSAMSPDSFTANVEIHHPPCHHHLGVVVEKSVINADVEGQPQPIMSTVLEPKTTPYSAIFPAITKMEAEKVDEERYMLKIVYNKALGAMSQVQRSVEMLKGVEFINVSVSEYDQQHMQSSSFLRVKKIKGSLLVTDEENLLERVKVMAKQLGLNLPCDPSSADN